MIYAYQRFSGVPKGHYCLFRVLCFGEQGSSGYKDEILYHSDDLSLLEAYCENRGFDISKGSWREYFIKQFMGL